jgi:hypothetical protein
LNQLGANKDAYLLFLTNFHTLAKFKSTRKLSGILNQNISNKLEARSKKVKNYSLKIERKKSDNSMEPECRMTRYGSFDQNSFNRISCANCYRLLIYVFPGFEYRYNLTNAGFLIDENSNILDVGADKGIDIVGQAMETLEYQKWKKCCDDARSCCTKMVKEFQCRKIFFIFS